MGNGIKEKQSENNFFTIEFFGVTLIVTTFMLLVALIFGEDVLFELGREIQYFLLGVFGYFSYPFLISVNVIGQNYKKVNLPFSFSYAFINGN